MGRVFVVYNSLPFSYTRVSEEQASGLIPDASLEQKEAPVRRRRRTRSTLEFSFTSMTDIVGPLGSLNLEHPSPSNKPGDTWSIAPAYQHPCQRIPPSEDLVYVGLVNGADDKLISQLRGEHQCVGVQIDDEQVYDKFYRYCDEVLTQLFHYRLFEKRRLDIELMRGWDDLGQVSRLFCEAIVKEFKPGDRVLILDHRLSLLPGLLKEASHASIPVGLHFGVPFPSSEIIRCHPQARQLMRGLLGADLIVFQVYSYIRHFLSSCTRLLGLEPGARTVNYEGLPVQLTVVPVGIDAVDVQARLKEPEVLAKLEAVRKVFKGQRVLLAIDGSETTKGIMHSLEAYERLLQLEPKWIGETAFVQVVTGRLSPDQAMVELVNRINNTYGYLGFHPVQLFNQQPHLHPTEYYALLARADVFLVISERSAFSIPALEYIACQEGRYGQLVYSEFIGHVVFLPGVFKVNPWDHRELAMVMQDALTVPVDEMINRHEGRSAVVSKFGNEYWYTTILQELDEVHAAREQYLQTPMLDSRLVYKAYLGSTRRLFLLDYDGTLVGIKPSPPEARPTPDLLRALRMLCQDHGNVVYVISGRDKNWLQLNLGSIHRLGLSAEHGCYLRPVVPADTTAEWESMINESDLTWHSQVFELMEYFLERTPGASIEHKSASLTWHYRQCDPELGQRQTNELMSLLEQTVVPNHRVEVIAGKKNLDVRPVSANKGIIVKDILRRLQAEGGPDFVLCLGDDRTDEDMFKVFLEESHAQAFSCRVLGQEREAPTCARYGLRGTDLAVAVLSRLALASSERVRSHPTV